MWNQPYLETCCRSALHRVKLSGESGRPSGMKDGPCLARMAALGLVAAGRDARYTITESGERVYRTTVLGKVA